MINIPLEQIINTIKEKTGLSEDEINAKINEKLKQLSDLISKEGAAHIIANELGVKLIDVSRKLKIKELMPGMRNVEIIGKVTKVNELYTFETEERSGKVSSFVMGDETAVVRVTLWGSQADKITGIKEGDVIKVKGAYVKENNRQNELHLSDRGNMIINPEGEALGAVRESNITRRQLADLKENEQNVEVLGTIVQVSDPRYFEVCPECNRRLKLRDNMLICETHDVVKPKLSYVFNVSFDDGTDSMRTVFYKNQADRLLEKSEAEILEFREKPEQLEAAKKELLGKIVKIVGRVNLNAMFGRKELIAQQVFTKINVDEEIKRVEEAIAKVQ